MDKKNETINDQILNLVNESLSNPKSNKRIQIGSVSPKLAAKVLKVTGIDIKGFKLVMDADHIRHILKNRHYDLSLAEFLLIPTILSNPDFVSIGHSRNSIQIDKKLGENFRCIEIIATPRKILRLKTFFIIGKGAGLPAWKKV